MVYWRMPSPPAPTDVARIAADVAASFPLELAFSPTTVAVFTWFAVGRYNTRSDLLNTFQAVLASDAATARSFVTLCYDNLVWDFGDASPSACCVWR